MAAKATEKKIKVKKTKIIKADIGITEDNKQKIADNLNRLLADEYVLYTKTRKFHWNVEGIQFTSLHTLFEEQYTELEIAIDEVAERVRKLGHYAIGSLNQFLKITDLVEYDGQEEATPQRMVKELCEDHETIIRVLRKELIPFAEKCKDSGTEDFLTGLMERHETTAWKLRATAK